MEEKLKLSFAIVTYNNSSIIENTVKNLISAIPDDFEYSIYLIDNKSTDSTLEVLNRFSVNPHIQVIEMNCNKGFGYGHNFVLGKINSKYHFVINPDIIVEKSEQIRRMIKYMEDNKNVGLLSPLIIYPSGHIQYLRKTNPTVLTLLAGVIPMFKTIRSKFETREVSYDKITQVEFATGCFMLFRTSIFKQLNGFDDKFFMYFEDADITRRAAQISKVFFYPKVRIIHNWQRAGHKKLKLHLIMLHSMFTYFNKWGWRLF